jgi:parallel beta-helix repeat protein
MTALSIQPPFPIITDIDGQPLEDGYIWIGTAGLNPIGNPISVYWDAALSVPAALPVRTRGGYPMRSGTPARLYVDSDYSLLVQNKNGSTVYSALTATERLSGVVVEVDATDVTFLQAGVGAVTRTAQAKMRDVVSVKDFGAVGNGVADDTVAIQAALTAGAGKSVYFPAGSYAINAALSVPANTYVYAESGTATVTQSTAAGTNAFTYAGDGITVDGLKIVGPNSGIGSAVRADSRNNPTIKNCQVQNWLYGIQFRGCKNFTVTDNRVWGGTYDSGSSSDIFIYGSTGAPSSRGIITGNFCLSNNDSGISVDTNSGDKEVLISSNVVNPLQSDGVTPLADANNRRRYGIIVGYNGTVNTRALVSGNVVRDVPYSGIYMNASTLPAGDVSITGNNVSRCGFGTLYPSDSSLRAGIFCNGGADSITGNVVVDCSTAGIKIAPGYTYSSTNQPRAVISANNVTRTAGYGIWLTIRPHGYLVTGNRVINSTNYNIFYETTSSDGGNCHFVGNHIDSNGSATGGIILANSLGGYSCSATGNRISGSDNTTNDQFNSGIWFQGTVHCVGNTINRFHRGVTWAQSVSARTINTKCASNTFENCAIGVTASGAGPWIVEDNTFNTVTTELSGAVWQGVIFKASAVSGFGGGPVIHLADSAAPTAGTWAVGDHCAKTNPAVGQPKGWFCTVAGTPGTWTSEGNL